MTGLNLESFLHLLRADLGAWALLGVVAGVLVLMTWTSWGSRRALRKCLVLSVTAHVGLALYGSTFLIVLLALQPHEADEESSRDRIRQIRVSTWTEEEGTAGGRAGGGRSGTRLMPWDRPREALALADSRVAAPRPEVPDDASALIRPPGSPDLTASAATPEMNPSTPGDPESRLSPEEPASPIAPPARATPADPTEVAPPVVAAQEAPESLERADARVIPERVTRPNSATGEVPLPPRTTPPPEIASAPPVPTPDQQEAGDRPAITPRPEGMPLGSPLLEGPSAAAEPEAREVPPAEVASPAPGSGSALPERDLRGQVRGPERRDPRPSPSGRIALPTPGPSTALAPAPSGRSAAVVEATSSLARPAEGRSFSRVEPRVDVAAEPVDPRAAPEVVKRPRVAPPPGELLPEAEVRKYSRPERTTGTGAEIAVPRRAAEAADPIALARVMPGGFPRLPEVQGTTGGRPLRDVPEVYRSRLDPNRSALAQRAGASPESEQAVERALDWLARHQDTDGRWDGATAKYDDGTTVKGDDDYTIHCPAGEPCFGECIYWEADTALTGLALLAYLGSGYTQADGKYAETVGKGLEFLLLQQKPDGDLRGRSQAVGMYCHAMATLALCEAYALTGDERLRSPVERAIAFLVNARAADGLAWRYAPGAPVGDTSILGWVVLALKSARVVGIPVPAGVQKGTLTWLNRVAGGPALGLARYQPNERVTPTMTAEAWVCRQFLGVGGPGPASNEAALYLLEHGPEHDPYNLYYWYYGTLAMYQHGGEAWTRWNASVRDQIVRRQHVSGHKAGSWDPDDSLYGIKGGRIYCTALATLSLEVYYRFLRLYDDPRLPSPPSVDGRRP